MDDDSALAGLRDRLEAVETLADALTDDVGALRSAIRILIEDAALKDHDIPARVVAMLFPRGDTVHLPFSSPVLDLPPASSARSRSVSSKENLTPSAKRMRALRERRRTSSVESTTPVTCGERSPAEVTSHVTAECDAAHWDSAQWCAAQWCEARTNSVDINDCPDVTGSVTCDAGDAAHASHPSLVTPCVTPVACAGFTSSGSSRLGSAVSDLGTSPSLFSGTRIRESSEADTLAREPSRLESTDTIELPAAFEKDRERHASNPRRDADCAGCEAYGLCVLHAHDGDAGKRKDRAAWGVVDRCVRIYAERLGAVPVFAQKHQRTDGKEPVRYRRFRMYDAVAKAMRLAWDAAPGTPLSELCDVAAEAFSEHLRAGADDRTFLADVAARTEAARRIVVGRRARTVADAERAQAVSVPAKEKVARAKEALERLSRRRLDV